MIKIENERGGGWEGETFILRDWLTQLWSLVSLKSAGQAAGWRPREEAVLELESEASQSFSLKNFN